MSPQWVPRRQAGVIEVVARIVRHADALHDATRSCVGLRRERDDLIQMKSIEGEYQDTRGSFACVAGAPEGPIEAPADFDARVKCASKLGRASPT